MGNERHGPLGYDWKDVAWLRPPGTAIREHSHQDTTDGGELHASTITGGRFPFARLPDAAGQGSAVIRKSSGSGDFEDVPLIGTSFPSSPFDGQTFTRTDLEQPNTFAWDAGRSKWLSVDLIQLECSTPDAFAGNVYFDLIPGFTVMSATVGWQIPFDCTVVGCHFFKNEGTSNLTVRLRRNGSNVFSKAFGAGTDQHVQSNTENTDISACSATTDCWSVFGSIGGAFTLAGAYARYYLRRKAT